MRPKAAFTFVIAALTSAGRVTSAVTLIALTPWLVSCPRTALDFAALRPTTAI